MALRDLKTNLRSLKYGNDQLGGGKSNQPYIITLIPEGFDDPFIGLNQIKISAAGISGDGFIRGGALSAVNSAQDLIRIGKFFTDLPRGPLFIVKQVGLQLSNPKIETGKNIGIENTRIYNLGINTLAQIPVGAFGTHFERHGLLPTMADQDKYEAVVTSKNNNTPKDNRLVKLWGDKIVVKDQNEIDQRIQSQINKLESKIKTFTNSKVGAFIDKTFNNKISRFVDNNSAKIKRALNPEYFLIDSYSGGPGSLYGIGRTTINRYVFTDEPRTNNLEPIRENNLDGALNYYNLLGASYSYPYDIPTGIDDPFSLPLFLNQTLSTDKKNEIDNSINVRGGYLGNIASAQDNSQLNSISYNYDMLMQQKIADSSGDFVGLIGKDFRENINIKLGKAPYSILNSTDYKKYNMMSRIGIGDPGKSSRDRTKINIEDPTTQDLINMVPLFKEDINDSEGGTVIINGQKWSTRDLIKFRFEAVDNDAPGRTVKIIFRAFIDSFNDNYNSDWMAHKYVGRGEKFYTYQGFDRQMSIGFKIAAQSRSEMKPIYQKLNYLVSNITPDYQIDGFMRGPYMLFTLGNWCYRQPVIINNINLGIKDNYAWEIAMNQPEGGDDSTMSELPQVLDVTMAVTPIHNFIPRKGATIPYINTGTHSSNNWLKPDEFTNLQ